MMHNDANDIECRGVDLSGVMWGQRSIDENFCEKFCGSKSV